MTKNTLIQVRVSAEEKASAEEAAKARGVTLSMMIRRSLANMAKRTKPEGRENA